MVDFSRIILILFEACCSRFLLGLMNELDEAIVSTETRKKRRRSGLRYSSRKVLHRSRVKRETSKVRRIQLESVTKTLSFLNEIVDTFHHVCGSGSSLQPCLDRVEEHDHHRIELIFERCNIKVSIKSFFEPILQI